MGQILFFFSLGVTLPFTSEAMLSCKSAGAMHTDHVIFFCSEEEPGQVSAGSTS